MLVLSKRGSPLPLIWIGLLLTAIGSSGAIECYQCSGDACKETVVESEECGSSATLQHCVYTEYPEERRHCIHHATTVSVLLGCGERFGEWRCFCDQDLCNTPAIWEPDPYPRRRCYQCSGDACKEDVVRSEVCDSDEVCWYSQYPEERRYCGPHIADLEVPCIGSGNERRCLCSGDLCNTPDLWKPETPSTASTLFAVPLLIILGSLVSLAVA